MVSIYLYILILIFQVKCRFRWRRYSCWRKWCQSSYITKYSQNYPRIASPSTTENIKWYV